MILAIGKEYTIKGILMDKNTGNPLLINGEQFIAIKTFIISAVNGTIDLDFTF
ncbi:hypothetical protein ALNOE001_06260 [Candidatus Methanobinarius endosymbioticus]|uniref:Uncharacterized protein n=1 Tax=Candidatus Methanobinarius endosymbioticus TaxID=2006182 RepID=A0A366MDY0_9EURY|nr:hypothetical protein ALNOE001_06260 [Candidatus Methanobinarius endosymbioticus]